MRTHHYMFPVAVHIFFLRDGQVLLLRRFNTGYEDGNYSVPAGHIEGNEPLMQAAVREVGEEIGIEALPSALEIIGVMHRKSDDVRVDFFLVATAWVGEPANCEPDKCDELAWYPLATLPENIVPYVKRALENYRRGQWFEAFGW
jgi:8-oxo-dGTP diphosphatase